MLMLRNALLANADNHPVLDALAEMGEWMAMGFYEAVRVPWPQAYGRAFRRLYENMDIVIRPDALLIPSEPLPHARTRNTDDCWTATSLLCDFDHNRGLRVNARLAATKKEAFPQHAAVIDALIDDLQRRLPHFGGYTHSNPDIRRVLEIGVDGMAAELDQELSAVQMQLAATPAAEVETIEQLRTERSLLTALDDYVAGIRAFHERTLTAAKGALAALPPGRHRDDFEIIVNAFESCFRQPADSFVGGLLGVHMCWILDGHDSLGRLDQALGPLFEQDLSDGVVDLPFARRLLDEMWTNFERLNGWNVQLGGYRPDGTDGCNLLTRECLEACRRNHFRRPNVALRITSKTPPEAVTQALSVLADGSGRPALYNDDLYVKTLLALDLGLTPEDARDLGFGGCTETMISGMSNVGSLDGYLNLAKALELAMHDGFDPIHNIQGGPHTGGFAEFRSYEEFEQAVRRQIQWQTDQLVANLQTALRKRFTAGDPKLYRTFFTRDCVKNHKSFEAGGARYNWSVISYHGIANLIDSLAAIRECVFARRTVSPAELLAALDADFQDRESLQRMLQAAPKFGNDNPRVDDRGAAVVEYAWRQLLSHETPRGGRFLPSCILFVTYLGAGQQVGATPDGRRAGEVLTDSVGAAQGRDRQGPTALLRSVGKLPLHLAIGTPVLNLRFAKSLLQDADGQQAVAALLRAFFAEGGLQMQLSVLDREEMLAAQTNPEEHADLIVRIGGYSEYFTRLPRELQDSVIARTEHRV